MSGFSCRPRGSRTHERAVPSPSAEDSRPAPGSSQGRLQDNQGTSPTLSGGDIDARWEDPESGGEETVGGSTATPGRNDLAAIGKATGVAYADGEELKVGEKEKRRDTHRRELDPASSEDYADRTKDPE